MLYKSGVAYPLRAESCQEAQFPFPTFTTYTIIIAFIFPPVLKESLFCCSFTFFSRFIQVILHENLDLH